MILLVGLIRRYCEKLDQKSKDEFALRETARLNLLHKMGISQGLLGVIISQAQGASSLVTLCCTIISCAGNGCIITLTGGKF